MTEMALDSSPGAARWRIRRNVLLLGVAFMVHFTAFHGAANLQSSLNAEAGVGTFTLAAIYGSLILSNIFLPAAVIRWLGCKWTVAVSFVAYMPFIAAQFYPQFYTLVPAGLMVGFGGGPLWCAKCTYLSLVAEPYSKLTGVAVEVQVVRFFGLFFMFYQLAQVWGNLISSAILSSSLFTGEVASSAPVVRALNYTEQQMRSISLACGANFCGADQENPNLEPPAAGKIHLIAGIYLACMIFAVACVAFGVDSLTRYSSDRPTVGAGLSGFQMLAVTLKQLRHKYQLLLLPVIAFIGAEQAFMAADFNASFVGCAWGIQNIGYTMICFGVLNAVAAPLAGLLVKTTGRYPVMLAAFVLHLSVMATLLVWQPRPDQPLVFFTVAALWGTADAVWLVQVNALSGILFPGQEEAAYSNFRLWEACGSVLAYSLSPYLCTASKLYLLITLLMAGMAGYTVIELLEYKRKRSHNLERHFTLVAKKDDE